MVKKMNVSHISNNHLKVLLNELLSTEELNEDLLLNLTRELRFSIFVCPGLYMEDGDFFNYPLLDLDDGTSILPVFTDENEYNNSNLITNDYEPVTYFFEQSFDFLEDETIKGIVINPDSEDFFVSKDIINLVAMSQFEVSNSLDNDNSFACDGNELKVIFDTVSNDSLIEFMHDESNAFDYDGLFNEFAKSMLNTIIINENLGENYDDIYPIEPQDIILVTEFDEDDNPWLVLMANKDSFYKKLSFQDNKSIYYAQLVNPDDLAIFALENDYEGIMLYDEEIFIPIPRSVLLEKIDSIKILCHNPRLNNSINYALR